MPKSPETWRYLRYILYLLVIGTVVAGLMEHDSLSRRESHFGRMVLAGIAIFLLHLSWELRRHGIQLSWPWRNSAPGRTSRLLYIALLVTASYAACNYYQFDRKTLTTVGDYADSTYYYLNSKYFHELGYTRLYEAMLVADAEASLAFFDVHEYRDLVAYEELQPRAHALSRASEIKRHFTPEQWAAFRHDLNYITAHNIRGGWKYFFSDHGYNPPPTWTLIGGTFSRLVPVEHMKWITMIDFALVALMMLVIGRVFGSHALLIALLFYTVTFSGRWPVLGQSILRFDWLVALVLAVCALKKDRHGLAGSLLAYAACSRVFPAIFFLPYAAVVMRDLWHTRQIDTIYQRFIMGAGATALLLVVGAWAVYGTQAYQDSVGNLRLHASPESYSSHRVGLGDALLYRGETSRQEIDRYGGIEGKREQLWAISPWLKAMGAIAVLWVFVMAWHSREPPHRLIWLGIYPLFCMTNPQINYYNLRLLPLLYHLEKPDAYQHRLGLYLLFAIEVATQYVMVSGAARYAVTCTTSVGLLIYLLLMAGFLTYGQWTAPRPEAGSRPVA